ncbi:MAG: Nitroreductase [Rhodoferax sp.]|nr:Nitroreductase [Rhodoferax sp.]
MKIDQLRYLVALARELDFARAAVACDAAPTDIVEAVRAAEEEFGKRLVRPATGLSRFKGFTEEGERIIVWARGCVDDYDALHRRVGKARKRALLLPLLERRSVSPKRLMAPGPDAEEIDLILQGALRSPDHGRLHPWRVVEFQAAQRGALALLFAQEKLRRDPLASQRDLQLAREHATRPPVLIGFVVSPKVRSKVPAREQWLAAGAALGNLLNAAHQLGFGAIVLSGERCFDAVLAGALGLQAEEFLAGFVSIGTVAEAPPPQGHAFPGAVWSAWAPEVQNAGAARAGLGG